MAILFVISCYIFAVEILQLESLIYYQIESQKIKIYAVKNCFFDRDRENSFKTVITLWKQFIYQMICRFLYLFCNIVKFQYNSKPKTYVILLLLQKFFMQIQEYSSKNQIHKPKHLIKSNNIKSLLSKFFQIYINKFAIKQRNTIINKVNSNLCSSKYKIPAKIVTHFILLVIDHCRLIANCLFILYHLLINMRKISLIACLLVVFLMITAASALTCGSFEVYKDSACVRCDQLSNTFYTSQRNSKVENSCPCRFGYFWSETQLLCVHQTAQQRVKELQVSLKLQRQNNIYFSERLLALTCDSTQGFIFKNNICINCRVVPYSNGQASSSSTCTCQSPYSWWSYYQVCGCYFSGSMDLYRNGDVCTRCDSILDATLLSQCTACSGGPFAYTINGCLNCSAIPNGVTGNSGNCQCATGYKWSYYQAACICDKNAKYAITTASTCGPCSSVTPSSQSTACNSCSSPYLYNSYSCIYTGLLQNYNVAGNACNTGFALKTDPITNETIKCACSSAGGYFLNGGVCTSCNTIPSGVSATTTQCKSCSATKNFYLGAIECIYCPNAAQSTGVAINGGCSCKTGFFWNAISTQCECDWINGYFGLPSACFNCATISFTKTQGTKTGCICIKGYLWDGTSKTCICDTTSGSILINSVCINCNTMIGSTGVVKSNACVCWAGYTWSTSLTKCVCDYQQNFFLIGDICYDCSLVPNSNGFASAGGCGCNNGLIWITSSQKCDCPTGYVNLGSSCASCDTATLQSGATIAGCKACSVSQGFALSGSICYSCPKQQRTTGVSTAASGCACNNSSMLWFPKLGGCACVFKGIGATTTVVGGVVSCLACTGSCSCGSSSNTVYDSNGICHKCSALPNTNGLVSGGACVCNDGYAWTTAVYPYRCYCSYKAGGYMDTTCKLCTSLSTTGSKTIDGCQACLNSEGFLLVGDTCYACSSFTNSNGVASVSGCGCTTGVWSLSSLSCITNSCVSPNVFDSATGTCVCDFTKAIIDNTGACKLCSSFGNSTNVALNSSACVCSTGYSWVISNGVGGCTCTNCVCNPLTSVTISGLCYDCTKVSLSTGPIAGTANCACPSYVVWSWNSTSKSGSCICSNPLKIISGSSCICNSTYSYPILTDCYNCTLAANSTGAATTTGCVCLANFVWNSTAKQCQCLTPFVYNTTTNSCGCTFPLKTNQNGICICDPAIAITKTDGSCFYCSSIPSSNNITLSTNTSSCSCFATFIFNWDAVAQTGVCVCPTLTKINLDGTACVCDPDQTTCTLTCDYTKGFILKNNQCLNCRDFQFSSGRASDNFSCICNPPYTWSSTFNLCSCYYYSGYHYVNGTDCLPCDSIADATVKEICKGCNSGGPFAYYRHGCINCSSMPLGSGVSNDNCMCVTGYKFETHVRRCICDYYQNYSISTDGCINCASVYANSPTLKNQCIYCYQPNFFWLGYSCINSSFQTNINTNNNTCIAGYQLKYDLITMENKTCVCSYTQGYFVDGNLCKQCSIQTGDILAGCTSCSRGKGFFKANSECIYCPSIPYSASVADMNGCVCQTGYYWNALNNQCSCDWLNGFFGPSNACINCSSILNTKSSSLPDRCVCVLGYVWDSTTKTCKCDITSGGFSSGGVCINCNTMIGALGVTNGTACFCVAGYAWDNTKKICSCDYKQNFFVINNICYDCYLVPNANGFASLYGCGCKFGLTWIPSLQKCDCPAGYVNLGTTCGNCQTSALPASTTVNGCKACNPLQGFALSGGICYACSKQLRTTGAATVSNCACLNSTMKWLPTFGGCSCVFSGIGATTTVVNGVLTCLPCTGACSCGYSGTGTVYDSTYGICHKCSALPWTTGAASGGKCVCNAGYAWTKNVYPYQCYCSYKLGSYINNTCLSCASLPTTGSQTNIGCLGCSLSEGFLLLSNDTCILCSSIQNSNGVAKLSGCGCASGYWDSSLIMCTSVACEVNKVYNPNTQRCDCDLSITIIDSTGNCILCSSLSNAVAPQTSTSCSCINNYAWINNGCVCTNCDCNVTTSAKIGGICYDCTFITFSTGPNLDNSACVCPLPLTWIFDLNTDIGKCGCTVQYQIPQSDGKACICNPAYAISNGGLGCINCQLVSNSTGFTLSGKCLCKPNYYWNASSFTCDCLFPYQYIQSSDQCACQSPLVANTTGTGCMCNPVNSIDTGSYTCFLCTNVLHSPGTYNSTSKKCNCYGKFIFNWNNSTKKGTCDCPDLMISNTAGNDCVCDSSRAITTSNGACINCQNDPYSLKISNGNVCVCKSAAIWIEASNKCDCNSTSALIVPSNINDPLICTNCPTGSFTKAKLTQFTCSCNISTLTWNALGYCDCGNLKALVLLGNQYICVTCNITIYSSSKNDSYSCNCLGSLKWNPANNECDCISDAIYTPSGSYACRKCDLNVNSLGLLNPTTCTCLSSALKWNSTTGFCNCTAANSVIFNVNSVYTCVVCNASIFAVSVLDVFTCNCMTGFVWTANVGCGCPDNTQALVGTGVNARCVKCDILVYSDGRSVDNITSCHCLDSLTWQTTGTCGCNSTSVVVSISGVYTCVGCTASINAKNKSTVSTCNCLSASLVWKSDIGICDCPNTANYIISGTATAPTCLICDNTIYATGRNTSTTCKCVSDALTWRPATKVCDCGDNYAFSVNNGVYTCVNCKNSLINTKDKKNSATCNCINTTLVWQPSVGNCDCPDSINFVPIISGTKATCVKCNATIYALNRATDSLTCVCIQPLTWSTTGICDCGLTSVIRQTTVNSITTYSCVVCNFDIFATKKISSTACSCNATSLVWDYGLVACVCKTANNVIFVSSANVPSCKLCDSKLFAVSKSDSVSCVCQSDQFIWQNNVGCVCSNSDAVIVGTGAAAKCVVCSQSVYASGKSTTVPNTCICLGAALTWANGTCGCNSKSAVFIDSSLNYVCVVCNSSIFAKAKSTVNACTCVSTNLVWLNDIGSCGCSASNSVIIGTGAAAKCSVCNSTLAADSVNTSISCNCKNSLIWQTKGYCDCGNDYAYYIDGNGNYLCVNCKNAAAYTKAKVNSTSCSCTTNVLSWKSSTGTCSCILSNAVSYSTGKKCVVCGPAAYSKTTLKSQVQCDCQADLTWNSTLGSCQCNSTSVVFLDINTNISSCILCDSTIYATIKATPTSCTCLNTGLKWNGKACACPVNYTTNSDLTCTTCRSVASTNPYACVCNSTSIYDDIKKSCVVCGTGVPNSVASSSTSNYLIACSCKSTHIWDVMTNTCILKTSCTSDSCSMNCGKIPNVITTIAATVGDANTYKNVIGGDIVKQNYKDSQSNYDYISTKACTCKNNFSWDGNRLRCFSNLILDLIV